MNLSDAEKRAAFYKAADVIERNPWLYSFARFRVGEENCPACMWGHVGRVLGLDVDTDNISVAEIFVANGKTELLYWLFDHSATNEKYYGSPDSAGYAAQRLRAFADHHWPAKDIIHHVPSDMSFKELIDSLSVAA